MYMDNEVYVLPFSYSIFTVISNSFVCISLPKYRQNQSAQFKAHFCASIQKPVAKYKHSPQRNLSTSKISLSLFI